MRFNEKWGWFWPISQTWGRFCVEFLWPAPKYLSSHLNSLCLAFHCRHFKWKYNFCWVFANVCKKKLMSGNPVKTDSIQVDRIFMIIQECCSNLGRNKLFIEFITMPTGRSCFPRTSNICQFDRSGRAEVEVPKLFFLFPCECRCKKNY